MFIRRANEEITILIVYVNDIGNDLREVSILQAHMDRGFEIKDLRSLHQFLKIEVAGSIATYWSLTKAWSWSLVRDWYGCRPVDVPIVLIIGWE